VSFSDSFDACWSLLSVSVLLMFVGLSSIDVCRSLLKYANLFRGLFRGSFLTHVGFFCSTLLMHVGLFCLSLSMHVGLFCLSLLMYVGLFLWSFLYDSFHACRSLLTCVSYLRQRLWRKRHRPRRINPRQCLSRRPRRQV